MQNRDVLISGASIAGPALAYWLHQRGFGVTVVERAPAPRPGGQTVDLRGAGRTVVERMHLMDAVRALCVDQAGIAFVDGNGRVRARMRADLFGGEGIVSEIEILRGDLCQVLYDTTVTTTEYLFDDTITALEQGEDGVTVNFESAPTRRFGLVVGADGLHSITRALAFGPETESSGRSTVTHRGSRHRPRSISTAGTSCTTRRAASSCRYDRVGMPTKPRQG